MERILVDRRNPLTDLSELPLPVLFFKHGSELIAEFIKSGDVIHYLGTSLARIPSHTP